MLRQKIANTSTRAGRGPPARHQMHRALGWLPAFQDHSTSPICHSSSPTMVGDRRCQVILKGWKQTEGGCIW